MTSGARIHRSSAVRFGGRPAATHRLVCLPYAGGGASAYRDWPALFPEWVEIVALRLPGRETRIDEPPLRSVSSIVDDLVGSLAALEDTLRSYSLFGHSLGAITSFELAREIRRRGYPPPRRLFVSGRCAPHVPHGVPEISDLPDPQFLGAIGDLGGMPVDTFAATGLLELLMPALRADFVAAESYRHEPGPPLDIPISAFGGQADETVSRRQVEAWGDLTTRAFRIRMVPGDHFFIQSHRATVTAAIRDDLESGNA